MKLESITDKYLIKKYQDNENKENTKKVNNYVENKSENENNIVQISIEKLIGYRKQQPFSMYSDEKKQEVKESIKKFGVLNPIIIRPIENEQYEIISGHNRVEISKELGKTTIPAIIKDVNDEIATLIMIDTNLCGRDEISPIDKGRAYKLRLDTIKKIRQQTLDNKENQDFSQVWENYSINKLIEETNESKSQIYRYISLLSLILEFQNLVTRGELSISVAMEVATLNEEQQEILYTALDDKRKKLKLAEIQKIKNLNDFTYNNVIDILENKKVKTVKFTGKLSKKIANKYKDKFSNDNDFTNLIDKLLEEYFIKEEQTL